MFGWTPTGGALYAIWVFEALLVYLFAAIIAHGGVTDTPYCETTGRWAKVTHTEKNFAHFDVQSTLESLQANPSSLVKFLQTAEEGALQYLRLDLATVPDSNLRTVSVKEISARREKGKLKEDTKSVLRHLLVDQVTFDQIAATCAA